MSKYLWFYNFTKYTTLHDINYYILNKNIHIITHYIELTIYHSSELNFDCKLI